MKYTIQVAPEDCTGCGICVEICPVKNKAETRLKAINMAPQPPLRMPERDNWEFFLKLPELTGATSKSIPSASNRFRNLFRVLRRLRGMRRNALSQTYFTIIRRPRPRRQCHRMFFDLRRKPCRQRLGPKMPRAAARHGRIRLFEDNAEFGLGFRLSIDKQTEFAGELVKRLEGTIRRGTGECVC